MTDTAAPRQEARTESRARPGVLHAVRLALILSVVLIASLGLEALFGRTGERIATQMCVSIAAIAALAIFSGNSGIISFGHAAFMALGAYTSGILTSPAGIQRSLLPDLPAALAGWELSIPMANGAALLVGLGFAALTGLALLRLKDASATIATLGILIIVHSVLIGARHITKGSQTFYGLPRITTFEVALYLAMILVALAYIFRESRWGLALRAVRDDETAAETLGINARRARIVAWMLSGALATLVGAYYGHMLGAFSPKEFYFTLTFSLVAMLVIGGLTTVSGAVGGVLVVTALQDSLRQIEGGFTLGGIEVPAFFGVTTVALGLLILAVIYFRPEGLFGNRELRIPALERGLARVFPAPDSQAAPPKDARAGDDLVIEGLTKTFVGLTATDDLSFVIRAGHVTGLIGPNGAGKSTLVNMLTGQYAPTSGSMRYGSVDLNAVAAHGIAGLGIARTFQNIRLFHRLTVRENVLVAAQAAGHRGAAAEAVALRELAAMGLSAMASAEASSLSYGARRKVEIARCLATDPAILLLDEPAAGMNPDETRELGAQLRRIAEERGIGLLLIEHDLEFVNALCGHIIVLNRGKKIAEGTPAEIGGHPAVIEAYMGRARAGRETIQPNPREIPT
ncbi:branched-chain amino acid ABC transporter ATP-binding protein/permease [Roseovarius aquimarinus]|uniref:ATP-binding cassette domain-containing protein n=1 Tax=Roseovarius aquimarinus TaxID=1229156 RepID=A0ABW7I651_9RHOB